MIRKPSWLAPGLLLATTCLLCACADGQTDQGRPNILFAISDDQSWPHAGAYGDKIVKTPVFDRIAREGVLLTHAFVSAPSCTPSRAAILTGQDFWRLEEGASLMGTLPKKFEVYPDLLETAGYFVGFSGKGWGPGNFEAAGRTRNPAGPNYENFEQFLEAVPAGKPFCFWFGSSDPHRPYTKASGIESGKRLEDVTVPPFFPDTPEVRGDILDYYFEIERFDRHVGEMLKLLEKANRLDNTIVVITSDNGMPFPRGKTNLYDLGTRMPLAVSWLAKVKPGRVIDDFVMLTDLAPTFLEAAGVKVPAEMTGSSLLPVLLSDKSGRVGRERDKVFVGRERHGWNRDPNVGYPGRAVRTYQYLYIRNYEPDRFPGYDTDASPTRTYLFERREQTEVRPMYLLWTGKRPAEELYDLQKDPDQIKNIADEPAHAEIKQELRSKLEDRLEATGDPRALGKGNVFDQYLYYGSPTGNYQTLREIRRPPSRER